MSVAEPQGPVDIAPSEDTLSQSVDASSSVGPETHGEHEAETKAETVVVETPAETVDVSTTGNNGDNNTNGAETLQSGDAPIVEDAQVDAAKKEPDTTTGSAKLKLGMSAKTTGSKPTGTPTPLVKKVCSACWPL